MVGRLNRASRRHYVESKCLNIFVERDLFEGLMKSRDVVIRFHCPDINAFFDLGFGREGGSFGKEVDISVKQAWKTVSKIISPCLRARFRCDGESIEFKFQHMTKRELLTEGMDLDVANTGSRPSIPPNIGREN